MSNPLVREYLIDMIQSWHIEEDHLAYPPGHSESWRQGWNESINQVVNMLSGAEEYW